MKKRKYTLGKRASQQQETRERIVDAAVALHEEFGPAATTISALAERAGVQRLTVYRHFATEDELLQACSSKWFSQNPPPNPAEIEQNEPVARTKALLGTLYGYYQRTEAMWRSLYRDRGTLEALETPMLQFDAYLEALAKDLSAAWAKRTSKRPGKRQRATIAHALSFGTWQSLAAQGLGRTAMTELVCAWIEAAGKSS